MPHRTSTTRRADITSFFRLGTLPAYVADMRMTGEYPNNMPISKDAFRQRCGVGTLFAA